jgi:hypothetical protein
LPELCPTKKFGARGVMRDGGKQTKDRATFPDEVKRNRSTLY